MSALHVRTPMVPSTRLARDCKRPVYLKLEALQPSGSFKIRGIGALCSKAKHEGKTCLISSSGGNAGLATVHAGASLGMPTTVYVPSSTPKRTTDMMRAGGADVVVAGAAWDEADAAARERVATDPNACYVPPFDHEDIWHGHASMVDEIKQDLVDVKPAAIVLSVGGGGLMLGVLQGLHRVGWDDVPVIAMETVGADSFNQSVTSGTLVTLPSITSFAKTLGAKTVSAETMRWLQRHVIVSRTVDDATCFRALTAFADDHRMLVEPSCAAALAALYNADVVNGALEVAAKAQSERCESYSTAAADAPIVVVVCGGSSVTLDDVARWRTELGL